MRVFLGFGEGHDADHFTIGANQAHGLRFNSLVDTRAFADRRGVKRWTSYRFLLSLH